MTYRRGAEGPSVRRTSDILAAAIEVHRRLGPGLLDSAYEECLVGKCRGEKFRESAR
ncbi:MAG: hypothetical protein H0T58_03285 [Gemmatimonadales bacterium]|nr:hypothetical protein [Gemmatimonadales bacterium]